MFNLCLLLYTENYQERDTVVACDMDCCGLSLVASDTDTDKFLLSPVISTLLSFVAASE